MTKESRVCCITILRSAVLCGCVTINRATDNPLSSIESRSLCPRAECSYRELFAVRCQTKSLRDQYAYVCNGVVELGSFRGMLARLLKRQSVKLSAFAMQNTDRGTARAEKNGIYRGRPCSVTLFLCDPRQSFVTDRRRRSRTANHWLLLSRLEM